MLPAVVWKCCYTELPNTGGTRSCLVGNCEDCSNLGWKAVFYFICQSFCLFALSCRVMVEEMAPLQTFPPGFTTGRKAGTLMGFMCCHVGCQGSSMQLLQRMSRTTCLANFIVGFCSTKCLPAIWLATAVFSGYSSGANLAHFRLRSCLCVQS